MHIRVLRIRRPRVAICCLVALTFTVLGTGHAGAGRQQQQHRLQTQAPGGDQDSVAVPSVPLPAACAEGCTERGNCNSEEGRCECALGRTGPTCEELQMPACQASPTDLPFWGIFFPKNCECYRQAAVFFSCSETLGGRAVQSNCQPTLYQYKLFRARCYHYTGKRDAEQWSRFPDEGDPGVTWHTFDERWHLKNLTDSEGRKAVNMWGNADCTAQPPHACRGGCSGRGSCVKGCDSKKPDAPTVCQCHKGFGGRDCAQVDARLCPNACNGRGACSRGFCHCTPPWFGLDCSRPRGGGNASSSSAPGRQPPPPQGAAQLDAADASGGEEDGAVDDYVAARLKYKLSPATQARAPPVLSPSLPSRPLLPTRTRPVIYMYELPHSVTSFVELDDNVPDVQPIYSAYFRFLETFLGDWSVRTEDPSLANLFYLPIFTYCYASNTGDPAPHLRHAMKYVRETYPWFNRSQGKDHFLWFTGDHGSCRAPPEATGVIQLVHFGYHKNNRTQGPSVMGVQPYDDVHGCFDPSRDIVSAPYNSLGSDQADAIYRDLVINKGRDDHRATLFFFAGGVRSERHAYSGGVRQAIQLMLKQLQNSSDAKLHAELSDIVFVEGSTSKYSELYRTARFCLAPHGSGFGIRLSIAMAHGCIPVVIQDHVYQPFEESIPYEDMTVRIAKRDIPDLIPILRTITEDEQRRMRLTMAQHYRAFIWEPHLGGLAYNYTLSALHRRLQALWGGLYRRRRRRRA